MVSEIRRIFFINKKRVKNNTVAHVFCVVLDAVRRDITNGSGVWRDLVHLRLRKEFYGNEKLTAAFGMDMATLLGFVILNSNHFALVEKITGVTLEQAVQSVDSELVKMALETVKMLKRGQTS